MAAKNILKKKFGRLIVIQFAFIKNESAYWKCICKCGKNKIIKGYSLRSGATKSCGCLHNEIAKITQNKNCYKHGKSRTKIYITWKQIRIRCYKKTDKAYKNYGGRGVKCLWKTFEEFYKDMGDKPSDLYSIERINNNGNYCKKNCKWATKQEQALNRRTSHLLTYKGKTQNMKTWARELKIPNRTLWWRINAGWSIERALNMI